MANIAVMPEKSAFAIANLITFLRIVFAVFVCMGSINEEKIRIANPGEVKVGGVTEMLNYSFRFNLIFVFPANGSPGNKVKVIFWSAL